MSTDETAPPSTIVLIHGLWMTPLSWENWIGRYSARDYALDCAAAHAVPASATATTRVC